MKRSLALRAKIAVSILLALLALWGVSGIAGAYVATKPNHRTFATPDALGEKPVEPASTTTDDGVTLSAWFVANGLDRAVILLPGMHSDRRQCIPNAEVYLSLGYSVLLPDLRGVGMSGGNLVSLGWHERKDLIAWFRYLQQRGCKRIGAHGVSLGAGATCYALKDLPELAFIVLESCYDTAEHALNNRLDLFHVPHLVAWPTRRLGALRIGVSESRLQPVDFLQYCHAPALILCGDSEGYLKVSETEDLYSRCASDKKRMHVFKGGHHEVFMNRFGAECRKEIEAFLKEVP